MAARSLRRAALGAGAALGSTVLFAPVAHAESFTVVNAQDDGPGSLRAALTDANRTPATDDVNFMPGLAGTIPLTTAIDITEPVNINGPGAGTLLISGGSSSGIFDIDTGSLEPVMISGLTLADGLAEQDDGGAVRTQRAALTVRDSVLRDNYAYDDGGAIAATTGGSLTVVNTTLLDSTAGSQEAGDGGAIFVNRSAGGFRISDSLISGNSASGNGGGISFYELYNPAVIERTTLSENAADGDGGGLHLHRVESAVRVENTTVSQNSAVRGSGVYLQDVDAPGLVTLASATIAGNTSNAGGAGLFVGNEPITVQSSIVADNGADLGSTTPAGSVFSLGFSLVENPGTVMVPPGSNILGQDPQLGPLADNGGSTPTQAPAASSPVVDRGASGGLTIDQRGRPRPVNFPAVPDAADAADMGAVELAAPPPVDPVVVPPVDPVLVPPVVPPVVPPPAVPRCEGKPATIVARRGKTTIGTPGRDVIVGTSGPDAIQGRNGNDLVCAAGGNDSVSGGNGKDTMLGGNGNDRVSGGTGNDSLSGGSGNDSLLGESGHDKLSGATGKDRLSGGSGKDRLLGGSGNDRLTGGPGKDTFQGGPGKDTPERRRPS